MLKESAFHAYDIRGISLVDFDVAGAFAIGRATSMFLQKALDRKDVVVVVQRDARTYGEELMHGVVKGIVSTGARVIDGGLATTPMHYFSIQQSAADGGVMVTASHNPPEYNGFKLSRKNASPIGMGFGLEDIRRIACEQEGDVATDPILGSVATKNFEELYIAKLKTIVDLGEVKNLRIVVDTSNGMTGLLAKRLFEESELDVTYINTEINMANPTHVANPAVPEGVGEASAEITKRGADIGFVFDGDGDRIGIVDEQGRYVRSDHIAALLATYFLEEEKNNVIVQDSRSSRVFREAVEAAGGKIITERVGHTFIKQRMQKEDALFAAEYTGHFYYRELGYAEGALLTMLYLIHLLHASGKTCSELTEQFSARYAASGEISVRCDKSTAFERIERAFAKQIVSRLDGVSVDAGDYWFNVRTSNTESVLRINIEAKNEEALARGREKLGETLKIRI